MAKSGRKPEGTGRLVNDLERLRSESQRVRRQCDEAVESLREGWTSLGRSGKLENGLLKRKLSDRRDKRRSRTSRHPHP
jgi:hypothetical protein